VVLASSLLLVALVEPARAQNVKEVCATAYDESQALRDQGKLLLARAQFTVCETACPAALAGDCTRWRADVDVRLPTIAPAARDEAGNAIADARLRIDGKPPVGLAAARQLQLDAGRHTFRFERPDGSGVDVEMVLEERAKDVVVLGVFRGVVARPEGGGAPPAPRAEPERGPPAALYALGGVAVAAVGVAGVLTIKGHLDRGDLYDCRPKCAREDVDAVATTWAVAGIAAGVGAVAAGAFVWWWVSSEEPRAGSRRQPAGGASLADRGRPLEWRF
jgi:hypothetical protein